MDEEIRFDLSLSDSFEDSFDEFPLQLSPMVSDDGSPLPPKSLMLMVHSARQVVTPSYDPLTPYLSGKRQRHIKVIEDPVGGGVGIAVNHEGLIVYIGRTDRMRMIYREFTVEKHIDATGMSVLPGFVDAHTHPVWAGDRIDEFGMKLRGMSYMQIHEAGGGIFSTVDATTIARTSHLYNTLCKRLKKMAESGTTLVECKSGYGLELHKELRLLEILDQAKSSQRDIINMSITYCGAHAIPRNSNMEETTKRIVEVDLPYIARMNESGKLRVENVDVFCDEGVFSEEHAELILWKAKSLGLQTNFHGDELHPMNSGQMGARVGVTAISHLEKISEEDIIGMKEKNIFAVLLPSTAYAMRLEPPPARALIDADVPVALGSDFNPNVYCYSMPLIMNLACVYMRMTMEEALVAATLNAAASLGKSDKHGSIVNNKFADLVIINSPRWENIIYDFGNHGQIIKYVVMGGSIVKAPRSFDGSLPLIRTDDVVRSPRRSRSLKTRERRERRLERKRRHSTSSSSTNGNNATTSKVAYTEQQQDPPIEVTRWYEEQIEALKVRYRRDLLTLSKRYGRVLTAKTGLYQCLMEASNIENEAENQGSNNCLLYKLIQAGSSSVPNANLPQAGPSGVPHVSLPQAGPSGVPHVNLPQSGPSGVPHVSLPQAGSSGLSHVNLPQAGPSGLSQVNLPQAGSSGVPRLSLPQAGPSSVPHVNLPQASTSHSARPPPPYPTSYDDQLSLLSSSSYQHPYQMLPQGSPYEGQALTFSSQFGFRTTGQQPIPQTTAQTAQEDEEMLLETIKRENPHTETDNKTR